MAVREQRPRRPGTATGRCAPSGGRWPRAPTCGRPSRCGSGSTDELGDVTFEELPVAFQVCAASIERAAEHWFSTGRVVDAVVASAAVPGLLPPAGVDGEHYLDGGIVNSVPLGRAVELGATRVFVLQVGRLDRPLTPPKRPWEVARVSFEIARRHRFVRELAELPDSVECHVLPARGTSGRDDSLLGTRDFSGVQQRIDATYDAAVRLPRRAPAHGEAR